MLTNAISEAIFESSGFAPAAVALIYAFLARKTGYSRLTRNISHTIDRRLMIDASSRLDALFGRVQELSWKPLGSSISHDLAGLVPFTLSKSIPSCRLFAIK